MTTTILKCASRVIRSVRFGFGLTIVLSLATSNLVAGPAVALVSGGPTKQNPTGAGYVDGSTKSNALYHTPSGLALDEVFDFLYVADRDNNAIRELDLLEGFTFTFTTASISKPVGVVVDTAGDLFVLNQGNGLNGTVLEFDTFGDLLATNATALTNAGGITLDVIGNIYVTASNSLIRINPVGVKTTVATISSPGASLSGVVVMDSGSVAVCDAGRHGILLIDPVSGIVSTNTGFNGKGDYTGVNNHGATKTTAKFSSPSGLAKAGNGTLVVADYGNHKVKVVSAAGVVTNLYGISSNLWSGTFPGFKDGTVTQPDQIGGVAGRLPFGLTISSDGTIYTTEDFYHIIRKVTGAALPPLPPPQQQVPVPMIGWVDFEGINFVSVLHPGSSFVFNNDVLLAIEGVNGSQVFFTAGPTFPAGSVPDPSSGSSSPPFYQDGLTTLQFQNLPVAIMPDLTIKAIGEKIDGSPNSPIATTRIQFVTANPTIIGNNAATFVVSNITVGAQMFYTIDGTDPTNGAPSLGPITNGTSLSFNIITNIAFKIRAFKANYQAGGIVSAFFSPTNFVPNTISFGFASGEASSDFIASPGQTFFAPVTLSALPNTVMYSLQFNLTVTNAGPNPGPPVIPGGYNFQSMLQEPIPNTTPVIYEVIPPLMLSPGSVNPPPPGQIIPFNGPNGITNFVNLLTVNPNLNLVGVGWLERAGQKNLYDTTKQTLISFSQAHDVLFASGGGLIEVGGFNFLVPVNATSDQTYQIQIGRPSATSDGVGAPGSSIFIYAPTNGSLGAGAINALKNVRIGQRKYIVGDSYPFRWFNAGDFGNTNLENADVEQVFQSAIYQLNSPPFDPNSFNGVGFTNVSDFFDSMDSCGGTYVDNGNGYLEFNTSISGNPGALNPLFDGSDSTIDTVAFGDGTLDVCDVYVTFRRSLDPSLKWFTRFWTNGVRVAQFTPNVFNPNVARQNVSGGSALSKAQSLIAPNNSITNRPKVNFVCADIIGSAGQTVQVPITAQVFGNYPLRVLMLNLSVVPLDGSPAITVPVQFTPNSALGQPSLSESSTYGNYSATWLNSGISGLTGTASIGTLTVTIPANASALSAYAVHFDHASGSPNGLASFPNHKMTGLITLSSRSNSSYGDGIPDSWRMRYFGTTNNLLSLTNADADGDGINNWNEYLAGSDPTNPKSSLRAGTDQVMQQQNQDCVVTWPSVSGKQYIIERSPTLFPGVWTPVCTNNGTGTDMEIHDTSGGGVRYYRVRVP